MKVRVVPLRGGGAKAAALHLRYIERDGVEKDGSKGELYGPKGAAEREEFEAPRWGEKHQFRLIVSPEDGDALDLRRYVRRFMERVEKDLGQKLEWTAVNHFDTDHPHAHIVIRGVDRKGQEVRLDRDYVSRGLRGRAAELATEELGPRLEHEVAQQRQLEVQQNRLTSLDRELERRAIGNEVHVRSGPGAGTDIRRESVLLGRLQHLEVLGLAERHGSTSWRLAVRWTEHLQELGERGDIIKQMHRALRADPARYRIVRPGEPLPMEALDGSGTATGRVIGKGLADELKDSFFAVVETPTGGGYYVPLDRTAAEQVKEGDWVSLRTPPAPRRRPEDTAIALVGAVNGGVYEPEAIEKAGVLYKQNVQKIFIVDTQHDDRYRPGGSKRNVTLEMVTQSHQVRLRELEKLGLATRLDDKRWSVKPDFVEELAHRDREAPRYRLMIRREAGLAAQVRHLGPAWLDRMSEQGLAHYGLGAEVRQALEQRRAVLRRHGVDPSDPSRFSLLRELARRERGRTLAQETGRTFLEKPGARFRGQVRLLDARIAGGVSYAEVSDGKRLVLVPASSALRAQVGRTVVLSTDARGRVRARGVSPERGDG